LDQGQLGADGQQSKREILLPDAGGPEAARSRATELGSALGHHRRGYAKCVRPSPPRPGETPTTMNALLAKIRAQFRRNKLEAEMAEEMRQHLERRTEEKI